MTSALEIRVREAVSASAFEFKHDIIHMFAAGSALHGASLPGKTDLDINGIFVESPKYLFGLGRNEHYVTSTSHDREKNTASDVDITFFSLRRWAALAAKGNPTAISYLFAPNMVHTPEWIRVQRKLAPAIVAKRAVNAYRGFVTDQMKRLLGQKGQGKHGQRPDLEALHGYDTKAAMHSVRLMGEAVELMQTGAITYPRPNVPLLLGIRKGDFSLDGICSFVGGLHKELDEAEAASTLQAKPDFDRIDEILEDFYTDYYGWSNSW